MFLGRKKIKSLAPIAAVRIKDRITAK